MYAISRRVALAVLLAFAGIVSAKAAEQLVLPPIVDPPSAEHHPGKIIFVELVTPDIAAAKSFYAALFGWTYKDIETAGTVYAQALVDGRSVAGLLQRPIAPGQRRQPAWLTYIASRDVDAAAKGATAQGAKLLFAPQDIPDRGREAVIADPQGAVFAVLASSSGDPPDFLAAPGEWIWSSLIARDPDSAAGFYQKLFYYQVFPLASDPNGAQHLLLADSQYARASINSLPSTRPDIHPYWLNFVRVEDTAATSAKLEALGGHVLVAPEEDRQGGKVAVVSDPQGAPFGLLEWPGDQGLPVAK